MNEWTDYSGHAMYQEALRAYAEPAFAAWLCETYPWGAVDLRAAHREWERGHPGAVPADIDEATLRAEFPGWTLSRQFGMYYAIGPTTLRGEDWTDLRDELRRWSAHHG